MIKAVIFDFGGVVSNITFDSEIRLSAQKLAIDPDFYRKVFKKYSSDAHCGKISTNQLLENLSSDLKIHKKILNDVWKKSHKELFIVNKDVLKLVEMLKKNGYVVGLLSNIIEFHASLIRKAGLYNKFYPIVLSCDVRTMKPEKNIYHIMLKKSNLKPDECLFIDDNSKYIIPAKKLGMKTILFKNTEQLKKDLKKFGLDIENLK